MKKRLCVVCGLFVLIGFLIGLNSCKLTGPDYTLAVTLEEGIKGEPEAGTYLHAEFTEINFKYENEEGKVFPELFINGTVQQNVEGVFGMYSDMDILVKQKDIRGDWKVDFFIDEIKDGEWEMTFSGATINSGTFTDQRGYTGTWEVSGLNFTCTYDNWNRYIFTATLNNMEGTWDDEGRTGNWRATRL